MRKIEENFSIYKLIKVLLLVCVNSLLVIGCISVKPSGVKSGKNLFETFYVGDKGTQYFIKPLKFTSLINEVLYMDFTFRYKDEIKDSSFVNLTLSNTNIIKNIDSLSLSNQTNKITCKNVKLLFNEKEKKMFSSRFSLKIPLSELNNLFIENNWSIVVYNNQQILTYTSGRKAKKRINKLKNKVFILFSKE